jgi:hypothetical protein
MILALLLSLQWPNVLLVLVSLAVLVSLLRIIDLKDTRWIVTFLGTLAVYQIVARNSALEQLREKEALIETMKQDYEKLKSETASARTTYDDAKKAAELSRAELDVLRKKVNAEFDRTTTEIKRIYSGISDEELDRRFNDALRRSRGNLQKNVLH